jgi:hypothetical protein
LATTGKVVGVNPEVFKIIDGKLYFSWSHEGIDAFAEKGDEAIKNADANWAKLNEQN